MSLHEVDTFSVLPKALTQPYFHDNIIVRYSVPGDGTCFFYSLCSVLNIDQFLYQPVDEQVKIGRAFRCNLTKEFTWEEWNEFLRVKGIHAHKIKTMDDLKHRLCSFRVWADEPVIRFIMYKFKINLIFLDEQLNKLYCGVDEPEGTITGIIYWVNKSHFEPLGRLNALDIDGDQVGIQFQFVKDRDHEFITNLMEKYNMNCRV
jgi:hypothetical protein